MDRSGTTRLPSPSRHRRSLVFETITLNDETLNRLKRASTILAKGHHVHESFRLVYIVITLLSMISVIGLLELYFFNRRVSRSHLGRTDDSIESVSLERIEPQTAVPTERRAGKGATQSVRSTNEPQYSNLTMLKCSFLVHCSCSCLNGV